MRKKKVTAKRKPGRKAVTLKVEGDWRQAVEHALKRGKPPKDKPEEGKRGE